MLERLSAAGNWERARQELRTAFSRPHPGALFEACWQEACRVADAPAFSKLFDPSAFRLAFNEVPVLYRHGDTEVYGIIDRLVIYANEAVILDYKTQIGATPNKLHELAAAYTEQMRWYATGVRKLYPDKRVCAILLFTACCEAVELDLTPDR